MNPISNRFLRLSALLIAAAVLLGACGGAQNAANGGAAGQAAPADQQVLRLRINGEPKSIDPQKVSFQTEISIAKQLFSPLFRYDDNLNVVADMAAEVPTADNGGISKDGKTFTIKLRDGLKWSDGAPLTSADVVYGFKRLLDPKTAAPYASNFSAIVGAKEYSTAFGTKSAPKSPTDAELAALRDGVGVSAPNATTVVFTLKSPSASFLNQLALWASAPVRKDLIEKYGDAWTEAGNLVGNGPFVLSEWVHNDHFTLAANPNWHLGKAKLTSVTIRIVEDDVAAYASYLAGELDVAPVPPANRREVATAGSSLNAQLVRKPNLATQGLLFNTAEKPWDNVKVRQAFATAVSRQDYVDGVLQGAGEATTSWLPPGMPGYDASAGKQYTFDAAKAKQLLTAAGYANGQGFPKVTLLLKSTDANKLLAQFLQEQFRTNLGVEVEIELADSATYQSRFQKGQFSFTFGGWSADWPYPDNWLPEHFGTGGGFNVYHYSNPKLDDLFARAAAESDAAKRLDLYGQAQRLVLDDAVVAPVYNTETFVLVKPQVRDLQVTGLDGYLRGDWNLWRTWIAKG
jgi:oligopeptide transport system substrate-binding protein